MSAVKLERVTGASFDAPECTNGSLWFGWEDIDGEATTRHHSVCRVLISLSCDGGNFDAVDVDWGLGVLDIRRAITALQAIEAGLLAMEGEPEPR